MGAWLIFLGYGLGWGMTAPRMYTFLMRHRVDQIASHNAKRKGLDRRSLDHLFGDNEHWVMTRVDVMFSAVGAGLLSLLWFFVVPFLISQRLSKTGRGRVAFDAQREIEYFQDEYEALQERLEVRKIAAKDRAKIRREAFAELEEASSKVLLTSDEVEVVKGRTYGRIQRGLDQKW